MKYFLLILLFFVHLESFAQNERLSEVSGNPFLDITGKPYQEISRQFQDIRFDFLKADSIASIKIINQLDEAVAATGSKEWALVSSFFKLTFRERMLKEEKLLGYMYDDILEKNIALLNEAIKLDVKYMELYIRQNLIDICQYHIKNYELAFRLCTEQEKALDQTSSDNIPEKVRFYLHVATLHYYFKDYDKAETIYRKILKEPEVAFKEDCIEGAYNGLGLIYRYRDNDLNRSDSLFNAIAAIDPETKRVLWHSEVWVAIGKGNLGYNAFLQNDYNRAIPLLIHAFTVMTKHKDFDYASGSALTLAEIYIKQNKLSNAKKYIDTAHDYIEKTFQSKKRHRLYSVMSKHYSLTGNPTLATAYLDSTVMVSEAYHNEYNAIRILRSEQTIHAVEQKLKDEELNTEKVRSTGYRKTIMAISVGFVLVILLLGFYYVLYRKKKAAYRELVLKSQQWAQVKPDELNDKTDESDILNQSISEPVNGQASTTEADSHTIMNNVLHLISEEKIYQNPDLTLDLLARRLDINRVYLSQAINSVTGKNFNTFINEYRVKEAIRIMSNDKSDKLSINGVAFDSGFNDRKTFYRVFKKITGLSPTDFRNNLQNS